MRPNTALTAGEDAMRANIRLACLWVIPTLIAASAAAADPDLRLVNAAAAQNKAVVTMLLKQRVDVNAARADGVTALLWAAHWNDLDLVDQLLAAGANVNASDDHGVTPLAQSAENAGVGMVEKLLKAGANPNAAQTSGLTPLMIAAHTANVRVVRALLAHGANVNATTTEAKATALMWAVSDQHADIVQTLIEAHADVHASTSKGFTPLMLAARNGDIETAKALIAAGVGVNETGSDGISVLPFSIISGKTDFALFLLEQGADPNGAVDGVRALHAAAGGVDLWLDDWNRRHGAASSLVGGGGGGGRIPPNRRLELVKALLERHADPNARISTSAMLMSYIGYPTKGAFEPFACGTGDLRGATPLWVVAFTANGGGSALNFDGGQIGEGPRDTSGEIMKALLAAGADPHLAADDGTTPLMAAAGLGRATFSPGLPRGRRSTSAEDAVKILLDAGADINAVNEADFTALHGAAFRGLDEVIQILVDRGANINARDYRGRTPFRIAEGSKQSFQFQAYPETAEFIKKLGADISLGIPGTVQERLRDVPVANLQN
jgi:uncharacterized protein